MCSEASKILAQLRVGTLVFGIRNTAKGEALATEIVSEYGLDRERILIRQVDLTSFESTKDFVASLQSLPRLDVLLIGSATNNTKRFVTGDGWEESKTIPGNPHQKCRWFHSQSPRSPSNTFFMRVASCTTAP